MSALFGGDNYRTYNAARLHTFLSLKWICDGWDVLDVGCGDGYFGDLVFTRLGARLTCADGRAEHIATLKQERPHLAARAQVCDLDKDFPTGTYDLVFACGILYHLENVVEFLTHCAQAAPLLFMESVVWNEAERDGLRYWEEADSYDQALNRIGARVTPMWIDRTLKEVGYAQVFEPPIPDHKDFRLWENPTTARVLRIAAKEGALPETAVGLREL